jgi:CRISPR-associated protein Csm3
MQLYGRVFIRSDIFAQTGLHIGGSGEAFSIGGVDNSVIKNGLTGEPYIPGSSLRGKMRSLTEKYQGKVTGQRISQVEIHTCRSQAEYDTCPICNIYGISAGGTDDPIQNLPTRLVVRDVALTRESAEMLQQAKTALPYTEVKAEVAIDRVTSQATPRDLERVPAGAVFSPMELVYSIYSEQDVNWFALLVDGLELLQDDYLGGSGSRGSGKILFENLGVTLKRQGNYREPINLGEYPTLVDLSVNLKDVQDRVWQHIFGGV